MGLGEAGAPIGSQRSRVCAVILAAGTSSRLGRSKLLLTLGGRSVIARVVETVLASRAMETVVVLGYEADRVLQEIARLPVRTVLNPDYASGMAGSLRAGVAAVSPEADAALVLLGDQPLVTREVIDRVIGVFESSRKPIVAPVYNGVQGNPVCFARALFPELSALTGDRGAKLVVERDPGRVEPIAFETDLPLLDLDVKEDYDALRRHFS